MTTPLKLPDGEVIYPSDGLLPATVIVQECEFLPKDPILRSVNMETRGILRKLYRHDAPAEVPDGLANQPKDIDADQIRLDFGAHRKGVLYAHDPRNIKLFKEEEAVFAASKPTIAKFTSESNETKTAAAQKRQAGAESKAIVGTDALRTLLQDDPTGGLKWAYYRTRVDENMPSPNRSDDWARWEPACSPTLIRALELLDLYVDQREERVLLYVDTPWIQT